MKKHLITLFMLLMAITAATKANAFTITTTLNPSEGGFILGAGNYNEGQTCTLTVQADGEHYSFLNWTENGEVVSISNNYSFTVDRDRNLVANFVLKHFDNTSHQFPDVMTPLCVVFIDSVEQTSPLLEVGAFCGDDSRGSDIPIYLEFTDRWMYFLVFKGESGENMTFRLYDHETQQEPNVQCMTSLIFDEEAGYNYSFFTPFEIHFKTIQQEVTHTANLNPGWNWWSTYIEQDGIDGLEMLKTSLGSSGLRIQGKTASVDYFEYQGQSYWYGSLDSITNEQMYKIRTSEACTVTQVGSVAQITEHTITINEGWNWIPFPLDQSLSLEAAFANFEPEVNDIIKGRNSSSTFFSSGSSSLWYGGLDTLEPGQGYMYKSNSSTPKTLIFNTVR